MNSILVYQPTEVEVRNLRKAFKRGYPRRPPGEQRPMRNMLRSMALQNRNIGTDWCGKNLCAWSQDTASGCSGLVHGVYGI